MFEVCLVQCHLCSFHSNPLLHGIIALRSKEKYVFWSLGCIKCFIWLSKYCLNQFIVPGPHHCTFQQTIFTTEVIFTFFFQTSGWTLGTIGGVWKLFSSPGVGQRTDQFHPWKWWSWAYVHWTVVRSTWVSEAMCPRHFTRSKVIGSTFTSVSVSSVVMASKGLLL